MKSRCHLSFVILGLITFIVPSINMVEASSSSNSTLDEVTRDLYQGCKGKDIHINSPFSLLIHRTNQTTRIIPWPYDQTLLKYLIVKLDALPFNSYQNGCGTVGEEISIERNGC